MKRLAAILTIFPIALQSLALSLHINPGELSSQIGNLDSGVTSLNLTGHLDARDLASLKNLPPNVSILNMAATDVVAFRGNVEAFEPQTIFEAGYLPEHLLFGCGLTEVYLPKNITAMGAAICADCPNLVKVGVSDGTTVLGDFTFYSCPALTAVYLPSSLETVGRYAMAQCPSLPVALFSSTKVRSFPEGLFEGGSSLTAVQLPGSLTSIGTLAFAGTGINELNLSSVSDFADFALANMPNLTDLSLNPDSKFGIGVLMNDHSLRTVTGLPKEIPDLFAANSSRDGGHAIANQAAVMGKYAFSNVPLDSVTLSPDLEYVDKGVFANVPALQMINATNLGDRIPDTHPEAFKRLDQASTMLKVSSESYDSWKAHPTWGQFELTTVGTSVEEIGTLSNDVQISIAGGRLKVCAPENIRDVTLWAPDGRLLAEFPASSASFEVSLESVSSKILIVRAILDSGRVVSSSFIK